MAKQANNKRQVAPAQKKQQQNKGPLHTTAKNNWWPYLALVIVASLIAFWPAFYNEWTNWDDEGYVLNNRLIKTGTFSDFFKGYVEGNYHPFTMLSLAWNYQSGALKPFIYHFTNVLLHVCNAGLVFIFLKNLTQKLWLALFAALLFGVHPVHVESVAWVSERKDVLYTFFFLLSLISYTAYAKNPAKNLNWYLLAIPLFLFSLLSKGQAVSLSVVLLLVDYLLRRDFNVKLWLEKAPFLALSLIFGIVAIVAQKATGAVQENVGFTSIDRICFASYGLLVYIGKMLVPAKLSNFYPYPYKDNNMLPADFYVYPFLALAFLVLLYFLFKKDKRTLFVGLAFYLITVGPVLQLMAVGSTIISDRYTYVPYIGLGIALGYLINKAYELKKGFTIYAALALVFFVSIGAMARKRCVVWKNSFNLWTDCIAKYPQVAVAHNNLGLVYKEEGKYPEAIECYNRAAVADPNYQATYENRGNAYFLTHKYDLALLDLDKAIVMKPSSEVAHNSKGAVLFDLGKPQEALVHFDAAIKSKPDYSEAYRNRANTYSVLQQWDKAIQDYNTYLQYDQSLAQIYYWRGIAYVNIKQDQSALNDFGKALQMDPKMAEVYINRARLYISMGQKANAQNDLIQAQALGAQIEPALQQQAQ